MAGGVNKVTVLGNLGQDLDTRCIPSGTAVTNITVATNESWKDKQSGEQKERAEWHRVALFGRLAEVAAEYQKRDRKFTSKVACAPANGNIKDGSDRFTTEIIANDMQMLGARVERDGKPAGAPPERPPEDDFDDDIPF